MDFLLRCSEGSEAILHVRPLGEKRAPRAPQGAVSARPTGVPREAKTIAVKRGHERNAAAAARAGGGVALRSEMRVHDIGQRAPAQGLPEAQLLTQFEAGQAGERPPQPTPQALSVHTERAD